MDIQSEFIGAVYSGNVSLAKELLKSGAQIGQDEILHCAAQRGNIEMLAFLLENGGRAFIDQFDSLALTPLTYSAKNGDVLSMKLLLRSGANVNAVDVKAIGNTTLREVVGDGDLEVIKLLLSAGADPNIAGWMQMTSIDRAKSQWENVDSPEGRKVLELLMARVTEAKKILTKVKAKKSRGR